MQNVGFGRTSDWLRPRVCTIPCDGVRSSSKQTKALLSTWCCHIHYWSLFLSSRNNFRSGPKLSNTQKRIVFKFWNTRKRSRWDAKWPPKKMSETQLSTVRYSYLTVARYRVRISELTRISKNKSQIYKNKNSGWEICGTLSDGSEGSECIIVLKGK